MKTLAVAVALLTFSASAAVARRKPTPPAPPEPLLSVTYDRFSGTTTISSNSIGQNFLEPGTTPIVWAARFKSTPDGTPLASNELLIQLAMEFRSRNWRYLDCHGVSWLLGGSPFVMPSAASDYQSKVGFGDVYEKFYYVGVTRETIAQLVAAQSIEYKICYDEFKVTPKERAALAELSRRIEAIPSAPPAQP